MRFPALAWLLLASTAGMASTPAAPSGDARAGGGEPAEASPRPELPSAREFAAALLAETNRVRAGHGLRTLIRRRELEEAADEHAAFMAVTWNVQHGSPIAGRETPADRIRSHGLELGRVAENVAARTVGHGEEHEPVGQIAAQLVAQWLASPRHRANLLSREFTHFGGAIRLVRVPRESWRAFGVQLFYRP